MAAALDPLAGVTWPTHGRAPVHVDQEDGGPCCDGHHGLLLALTYLGAAWPPRGLAAARKTVAWVTTAACRRVRTFFIAAIPDEIRLNAALSLAE